MDSAKRVSVDLQSREAGRIHGIWEVDEAQRNAAWELYVELVTRISVIELKPGEGLLREALSSLYTVFDSTRAILREHGPEIAQSSSGQGLSFGYLSITMLNSVLRPVLAKWHPLLLDYESQMDEDTSPLEHEHRWDKGEELRENLTVLRGELTQFADVLGQAAEVSLPK